MPTTAFSLLQITNSFVDLLTILSQSFCNNLKIDAGFLSIVWYLIGEGVDHGTKGDNNKYEVIFPAGTNCSLIEIPIKDDKISEMNETFTVRIMEESLPFSVALGDKAMADVNITDNDSELF